MSGRCCLPVACAACTDAPPLRALSDAIPALRSLPAALGLCPPLALAHIAHSAAGTRHLHSALSVGASRKPFRACLGGGLRSRNRPVRSASAVALACVRRLRSRTHARLSKLQTSYKRASRAPTLAPALNKDIKPCRPLCQSKPFPPENPPPRHTPQR